MYSTFTSTWRRDGLLSRHAVRSDLRIARAEDVLQIGERQPGVDDVLDDEHVLAVERGVEILEQPHFAGARRAFRVARDGHEVERHVAAHVPDEIRQEHEGALEHARRRAGRPGKSRRISSGQFGDALLDLRGDSRISVGRDSVSGRRQHRCAHHNAMKRFDIITESRRARADARRDGDARAAAVTSRRWRTTRSRERRITVVHEGRASGRGSRSRRSPTSGSIAIGSDHTGIKLRQMLVAFLRGRGLAVNDLGTDGPEPVDYPDVAAAVGASRRARRGRRGHRRSTAPASGRRSRPTRSPASAR